MNKKKGKVKTSWVCESCGHSEGQWWGSCRACNKVGTMRRFSEGSSEFVSGGGDDDGKLMMGEISEVLRCLFTCMTSYDYALEKTQVVKSRISDVSYEKPDDPDGGLERRGLSGDS
ncbi:hypothetical protein Bca4012_000007 [Brassica carinata]|uniref:LapB rubredoxin metal binding domain-containing protein n=1 Tax=Brassica carinata TaxID=52824 RepID=A0A8X7WTE0_BRACI|nr:hypothetical protein Bca52824_006145 [Brassica carinata]